VHNDQQQRAVPRQEQEGHDQKTGEQVILCNACEHKKKWKMGTALMYIGC
jgi:hypothetical protein